jgi:hypothetical protein
MLNPSPNPSLDPSLDPSLADPELLKVVVAPLLEDFQFWFRRTRELLEQERLGFLEPGAQADLLARLRKTQQQVTVAQSLLEATAGEAGIEMTVLTPWHQLVLECWQVSRKFQRQQTGQPQVANRPSANDSVANSQAA